MGLRRWFSRLELGMLSTCEKPMYLKPPKNPPLRYWASWFFALHVVLALPIFTPNLRDIGMFDEAGYVNSGREFLENVTLPAYGNMPLVTCLYALTYLPVRSSAYWLIHSCAIARFMLFSLLWLGAYLVAKQFSYLVPLPVLLMFLILSPALTLLVTVGSHALFAAMSTFALWQALSAYRSRDLRHLWFASVFTSFAGLCRSGEGLVLLTTLLVVSLFVSGRAERLKLVVACIAPFLLIVGGYVFVYRLTYSSSDLGAREYAYNAFEQGHGLAYQHKYGPRNYYVEGQLDARRLFGTPAENHYSILTAIRHNPRAYLSRIPRLLGVATVYAIHVYGGGLGLIIWLLAARGAVELWIRKQYLLLFPLILWPTYLLLYLLLVFQQTHFLIPFASVFLLAAIGLLATASTDVGSKERYIWSIVLLLIAVASALIRVPGYSAALAFLVGLWTAWVFLKGETASYPRLLPVVMLLLVISLLKGGYPAPKFRTLGVAPDEQAALYIQRHLSAQSRIASYQPGNVWITKRQYVPMQRTKIPDVSSDVDLSRWIKTSKLDAIYADDMLRENEPQLWSLIEAQIGGSLQLGYSSSQPDVQVILVKSHT